MKLRQLPTYLGSLPDRLGVPPEFKADGGNHFVGTAIRNALRSVCIGVPIGLGLSAMHLYNGMSPGDVGVVLACSQGLAQGGGLFLSTGFWVMSALHRAPKPGSASS
jgi:hypothetical protein